MIAGLEGLGAIGLFLIAGLGLVELLPALARRPLPARLGYAYLLGIAWIGGGLFVLSHGAAIPLTRPAVLVLAALPILAGAATRLLRPCAPELPRRRRLSLPLLAAVAVAGAVTLSLLADAVAEPPRDWDGRMTWSAQARYLRAEGTVDAQALRQGQWFVSHPRYPLLLPLAQVAVLEAFGAEGDEAPYQTLYAGFFPAFLLVLWDAARRWAGPRPAGWITLAAAALPFPAFSLDGGAIGSYSDLPLACFYGATLALLLRARPTPSEGIAAGILLAAALLTKNEGFPLATAAVLLAAALGLARRFRRNRREASRPETRQRTDMLPVGGLTAARRPFRSAPLALAALLALAAFAVLASWRAGIPNRHDERYIEVLQAGPALRAAVTRAPALLPVLAERMSTIKDWVFFWWVVPVLLLAGRHGLRHPVAPSLALAAALPLLIAWAAYAVHPDPVYLAGVTWSRMLLQGALPLLLLLALALRPLLSILPPLTWRDRRLV